MKTPAMPYGLGLRPAMPKDQPFLEDLHRTCRDDLQLIEGDKEFVEAIIAMQFNAQNVGYGTQYPNAMYWIVEKQGQNIGKATIDFGSNFVHLVDLAFIPEARGKGFGRAVLESIQHTSKQVGAPMSLSVLQSNVSAKKLYLSLGFVVESVSSPYEMLVWYPPAEKIIVGA